MNEKSYHRWVMVSMFVWPVSHILFVIFVGFQPEIHVAISWLVVLGIISLVFHFKLEKVRKRLGIKIKKPEKYVFLPTQVSIEKTDDVTENIRRYKEAQRLAVEQRKCKNA